MRIHGIGIDVVEVGRIAEAIERHGEAFLARLFTAGERAYCEAQNVPALHFAARFAAKEAVAKALDELARAANRFVIFNLIT